MANPRPVNNQRKDRGANRKRGNVSTAPESREVLAKSLRLRPKTKALVDMLLEHPELKQSEVYRMLHPDASVKTSHVESSKILSKPSVQIYKDSAVSKAKERVVTLVDSSNESIALKASQDILDRTVGKATIKSEHLERVVKVQLDVTGVKLGGHNMLPRVSQEVIDL